MRPRRVCLTIATSLMGLTALAQTVPTTINYQGRLTDNSPQQNPISGAVPMRFAIWDAATSGTNLWQEPAADGISVPVTGGLFNIALGSNGVPFTPSVFAGATSSRYLEITLHPDTPQQEILAPRQLITATPYANLAGDSTSLGGVTSAGWQKALTTPACPANQFYTGISASGAAICAPGPQGPQGPPGPPGPTSIASCPAGMTKLDFQNSTLCWAVGPTFNWNQADDFCDQVYRGNICTLLQWRMAVCRAGTANPGRSWTPTATGTATFSTVAGCSAESVSSFSYSTFQATTCCLEWMRY
jgi:hypothetical protein